MAVHNTVKNKQYKVPRNTIHTCPGFRASSHTIYSQTYSIHWGCALGRTSGWPQCWLCNSLWSPQSPQKKGRSSLSTNDITLYFTLIVKVAILHYLRHTPWVKKSATLNMALDRFSVSR